MSTETSAYAARKAEDEAFRQRVSQNESLLKSDPEKYLSKTVRMAVLGFFLYLCVLGLVTLLVAGLFFSGLELA